LEAWKITSEEMNALGIFERKIVRRTYGSINEGENWRIRTNKEIRGYIRRGRYCKIYKISQIKMVWTY
jgi:hypothetical protein